MARVIVTAVVRAVRTAYKATVLGETNFAGVAPNGFWGV
jgi:hypothetical protein